MNKTTYGVYSTYRSQLGNGEPVKKYETRSQKEPEDKLQVEPLYPTGFGMSEHSNIQDNEGVEVLYPAGVQVNTRTVNDLRSQLSEAVRLEFQGLYELFEILDSERFSYGKFQDNGTKTVFESSYRINESGILDVSWTSSRSIETNQSNDLTELQDYADRNNMLLPSDLNVKKKRY